MIAPGGALASRMIDVHYHAGPDITRRRHSVVQAGRHYRAASGWVVVKSHLDSTAAAAWEARQEGFPVSGSVVLNALAGGVDHRVVQRAVFAHGGDSPARLVVYLPTLTPHPHASALPAEPFHPRFHREHWSQARVTDDSGHLRPEVRDVLRCARDLDVVVATGHCQRDEVLAIVDAAADIGLDRLLLTHATHPLSGFSETDIGLLSTAGHVWVEVTALTVLMGHRSLDHLARLVASHPRVVLSSDLGQLTQPDVPEAWAMIDRWCADLGVDREAMTVSIPHQLLAGS
jgi:hypothetical protein